MRVYKEISPLDKLNDQEAKDANQKLALVALALFFVVVLYVLQ
jgi:hypothetical protein